MSAVLGLRRRIYTEDQKLGELARDADDALRNASTAIRELEARMAELEAAGGGGGSVTYGSPVALPVGGSNVDGAATALARSDHKHALPAFGTGAGTFAEGNDARLSDARTPTAHKTTHQSGGSDAIKLDDLTAPDDNTDLNVSITAHGLAPKLPNDSLRFLDGSGAYRTPGIGGINIWLPDAPPVSAHAKDDEFDGVAVDAKWTVWNHGAVHTVTLDTARHMMKMVQTGIALQRWGGVYQAVPASEFAVYTRCHIIMTPDANGGAAGIVVGDDLSNTASDFRSLDMAYSSSAVQLGTRTWSAYNGTAGTSTTRALVMHYLRMRVSGTTCASDFSLDGIAWNQLASVVLAFTPVHVGIALDHLTNAVEGTAYFSFFRMFSGTGTSGYNATSIGRYL